MTRADEIRFQLDHLIEEYNLTIRAAGPSSMTPEEQSLQDQRRQDINNLVLELKRLLQQ